MRQTITPSVGGRIPSHLCSIHIYIYIYIYISEGCTTEHWRWYLHSNNPSITSFNDIQWNCSWRTSLKNFHPSKFYDLYIFGWIASWWKPTISWPKFLFNDGSKGWTEYHSGFHPSIQSNYCSKDETNTKQSVDPKVEPSINSTIYPSVKLNNIPESVPTIVPSPDPNKDRSNKPNVIPDSDPNFFQILIQQWIQTTNWMLFQIPSQ